MLIPTEFVETLADFQLSILQPSDVDTFVSLFTDTDVMKHIGQPLQMQEAVTDAIAASSVSKRPKTRQLYLRIASAQGCPAGVFSVEANKDCTVFEIGIMLLPCFQRTGLTALVVKNVCVKLLNRYSECLICCQVKADNEAAKRRALKLGFVETEVENEYVLDRDIFVNS